MEKTPAVRYRQLLQKLWIFFLLQILFFAAGILLISALLYQELIPVTVAQDGAAVFILAGAVSFVTTAVASLFSRHDLFLKSFLTQAVFWGIILFISLMFRSAPVEWLAMFATLGIALGMTVVAALLFGGKRKKKFQKNRPMRLKKK